MRSSPAADQRAVPAALPTTITIYGCDPDEAALFRAAAARLGVRAAISALPAMEDTAELARGSRCVSVGHRYDVSGTTLRALRRAGVELLCTRSIGDDHIDRAYAARVGIEVATVRYSPDSVADFTLMLVLMALRHAKSMVRRADRHDYRLADERGRELRDLTVGVVGTGRIGSAVVTRLHAFGARVRTHDKRPGPGHVPLDDLLRTSDVVTLHTPLDRGSRHLLDASRIARMKPGAVLVNTGRGGLVDTTALLAALEDGHLAAAALDVVEGERGIFYADHGSTPHGNAALARLQQLPNVVISPHTAFHTDHALADTVEQTLATCLAFERRSDRGRA